MARNSKKAGTSKRKVTWVGAAKFKEQCLAILDRVDHVGIVITKHGRPVARLTRYEETSDADLIGAAAGQVGICGDIMSTGIAWDAES